MAIPFDTTLAAINNRVITDIQNELPGSNPFIREKFLYAMGTANAGRFNDFYLQGNVLQQQMFPDTATGDFLLRWGSYKGLYPTLATSSLGFIVFSGTIDVVIPEGTILQSLTGLQYETLTLTSIGFVSLPVSTLTSVGNIATVTTVDSHNLATNSIITISGADQSEYNITATIIVTSNTTFIYSISGSPATPATGVILVNANTATVQVRSLGQGSQNNVTGGSSLSIINTIAGINSTVYVQFDGIEGGIDNETDTSYRIRVLNSYRNPTALFNANQIEQTIQQNVAGVTRVFVIPITPEVGQVTIYFMMDIQYPNELPPGTAVDAVNEALIPITPVNTDPEDIFVNSGFSLLNVDFTFTFLNPNTSTMQQSIIDNLNDFFLVNARPGVSIPIDEYRAAIQNTIDVTTGQTIIEFTLTSPSGSIVVPTGQLAQLGNVVFT